MSDFSIISCADSTFFNIARVFEANVLNVQGQDPIIYDLGLSDEQAAQLRSEVRSFDFLEDYNQLSDAGFIKTTHKPAAILDALDSSPKDCLYLDIDMLLTDRLNAEEFAGADLCITPRHPSEKRQEELKNNGTINAGFLYFRNTPEVRDLVIKWGLACAEKSESDQLALSNLLGELPDDFGVFYAPEMGLKIRALDPEIYNDTDSRSGKVLHFKGLGRKEKKRKRWRRYARMINWFPIGVRVLMSMRRRRSTR